MGKFQRKYPEGAAEVIYRLKFEEGKTYQEAVHAASLGCYGVPPFTMSVGTAETYARKIKRQREGKEMRRQLREGTPEEQMEALRLQIVGMIDEELQRLRTEGKKTGQLDLDRLSKAARVRAQLGAEIQPRKLTGEHESKTNPRAADPEVQRIVKAHKRAMRGKGKLGVALAGGGVLTQSSDEAQPASDHLAA